MNKLFECNKLGTLVRPRNLTLVPCVSKCLVWNPRHRPSGLALVTISRTLLVRWDTDIVPTSATRLPLSVSWLEVMIWNGMGVEVLGLVGPPGEHIGEQLPETMRNPVPHLRVCNRSVATLAGIRTRLTRPHS